MSRFQWSRVALLCASLMMAFTLLVACGGDDDAGSGGGSSGFPVPSGAEKLGEEGVSADELDAQDVDISDAKAHAYKVSGSSIDDVAAFYKDGVTDDGWTVSDHVAIAGMMIAVLHNGDRLVVTTAMTAEAARSQGDASLGDLDVDLDDLADDDVLIVGAIFTCNEDSVDTCVEAMGLGL